MDEGKQKSKPVVTRQSSGRVPDEADGWIPCDLRITTSRGEWHTYVRYYTGGDKIGLKLILPGMGESWRNYTCTVSVGRKKVIKDQMGYRIMQVQHPELLDALLNMSLTGFVNKWLPLAIDAYTEANKEGRLEAKSKAFSERVHNRRAATHEATATVPQFLIYDKGVEWYIGENGAGDLRVYTVQHPVPHRNVFLLPEYWKDMEYSKLAQHPNLQKAVRYKLDTLRGAQPLYVLDHLIRATPNGTYTVNSLDDWSDEYYVQIDGRGKATERSYKAHSLPLYPEVLKTIKRHHRGEDTPWVRPPEDLLKALQDRILRIAQAPDTSDSLPSSEDGGAEGAVRRGVISKMKKSIAYGCSKEARGDFIFLNGPTAAQKAPVLLFGGEEYSLWKREEPPGNRPDKPGVSQGKIKWDTWFLTPVLRGTRGFKKNGIIAWNGYRLAKRRPEGAGEDIPRGLLELAESYLLENHGGSADRRSLVKVIPWVWDGVLCSGPWVLQGPAIDEYGGDYTVTDTTTGEVRPFMYTWKYGIQKDQREALLEDFPSLGETFPDHLNLRDEGVPEGSEETQLDKPL